MAIKTNPVMMNSRRICANPSLDATIPPAISPRIIVPSVGMKLSVA